MNINKKNERESQMLPSCFRYERSWTNLELKK